MVLDRSFWVAVGITSYVALAGLAGSSPTGLTLVGLAVGPIGLWELWRQTRRRLERAVLSPELAWVTRVAATAAVCWVQARIVGDSSLLLEVVAVSALSAVAVGSLYAVARIERQPGLVAPPRQSRSLDAAAFAACLWAIVLVLAIARFTDLDNRFGLDPLTLDYAHTTACVGTLLLFVAASWRIAVIRKLELGVPDRALGGVVGSLVALAVAIPATLVHVGPPDRVLPIAVLAAAATLLWTSQVADPARISGVLRAAVVGLFLGSPIALFLGGLAESHPTKAPLLVLGATVLAMLVGVLARRASVPLAPVQARWLEALEKATAAALVPEPTAAVVATLGALKQAFRSPKAAPQLWRVEPAATLSVDVAGYLSEQPAKVPSKIYELAQLEPERTLRRETIAALQVTRTDLRGLLDWFDVRDAFCATALLDGEDPVGFLLMPQGERTSSLTMEEAKALNNLGQRLSSMLGVTATLARARTSEVEASRAAERWQSAHQELLASVANGEHRHQLFARHLARPALSTAYSLRARQALAAVEDWPRAPQPQLLLCPTGVDPKPWAAAAHLANRNGAGPLLLIDGGYARNDASIDWNSAAASPFSIAWGGTLFIQDAHLLGEAAQASLTAWLTRPSTSFPESLGDSVHVPPCRVLLSFGFAKDRAPIPKDVLPALTTLLPRAPVLLPELHERPEDLRALVLDILARTASGQASEPLSIDRQALQHVLDYEWPGNEDELRDALHRAAAMCKGGQIRTADLRTCGFSWADAEESPAGVATVADSIDNPPPRRRRAHIYHTRGRKP
jgi:hypothetical protein